MKTFPQDNAILNEDVGPIQQRKKRKFRKDRLKPKGHDLSPGARRKHRTTEYLIRHIVTDLNRTLTARQIAYFHGVGRIWVLMLAKRLRGEGFKIPKGPKGHLRNTRVHQLIRKFKAQNQDLLKGKISATIFVDDKTYYLNGEETKRLLKVLPQIAAPISVPKKFSSYNILT